MGMAEAMKVIPREDALAEIGLLLNVRPLAEAVKAIDGYGLANDLVKVRAAAARGDRPAASMEFRIALDRRPR